MKKTTVSDVVTHCFPGDLLPNLAAYLANETYTASYTARPSIGADIPAILMIHKQDLPNHECFPTVGTSFFNARRLDMNHYLTFGHNDPYDAHLGERALLKGSNRRCNIIKTIKGWEGFKPFPFSL